MAEKITLMLDERTKLLIHVEPPTSAAIGERLAGRAGETAREATVLVLKEALQSVTAFGEQLLESVAKLAPDEATVEFGLLFKTEAGVFIAKTSGEGNVKITLSWNKKKS